MTYFDETLAPAEAPGTPEPMDPFPPNPTPPLPEPDPIPTPPDPSPIPPIPEPQPEPVPPQPGPAPFPPLKPVTQLPGGMADIQMGDPTMAAVSIGGVGWGPMPPPQQDPQWADRSADWYMPAEPAAGADAETTAALAQSAPRGALLGGVVWADDQPPAAQPAEPWANGLLPGAPDETGEVVHHDHRRSGHLSHRHAPGVGRHRRLHHLRRLVRSDH